MKDPESKGSHILKNGADPYIGGEVWGRQKSAAIWISGIVLCVTRGDLYAMIIATHLGRHKEVSSAIVPQNLIKGEGQNHLCFQAITLLD